MYKFVTLLLLAIILSHEMDIDRRVKRVDSALGGWEKVCEK